MTRMSEEQLRRRRRAERMRRERMRARRQRALAVAVAILLVVCGVVWALRPPPTALISVMRGVRGDISFDAVFTLKKAFAAERTRAQQEAARPKPLVPAPGVRTIVVDKSDQTVTLYEKTGKPIDRFPCASGVTYPRIGEYHGLRKVRSVLEPVRRHDLLLVHPVREVGQGQQHRVPLYPGQPRRHAGRRARQTGEPRLRPIEQGQGRVRLQLGERGHPRDRAGLARRGLRRSGRRPILARSRRSHRRSRRPRAARQRRRPRPWWAERARARCPC